MPAFPGPVEADGQSRRLPSLDLAARPLLWPTGLSTAAWSAPQTQESRGGG